MIYTIGTKLLSPVISLVLFLHYEYQNYIFPLFLSKKRKGKLWIRKVPTSRMQYPTALHDKIKYWVWKLYTPFHPHFRDFFTYMGIVRHKGRQNFLVGSIMPSRSVREFVNFLIKNGFGNHFIAWKDTDEIISLRQTVGFRYQYHIRIFNDGEVRCHYEYTPEYRPIKHMIQAVFEDRSLEFRKLLKDWIV